MSKVQTSSIKEMQDALMNDYEFLNGGDQVQFFKINAILDKIMDNRTMYYPACTVCNKKVMSQGSMVGGHGEMW